MNKFLNINNIVSNTSTGVKDTFSLSRLNTILIVKGIDYPHNRLTSYANSGAVLKDWGLSDLYDWSSTFFSVTSKKATKPETLNVFVWNDNITASALVGKKCSDISILKTLKGGFTIEIGDVKGSVNVDLTTQGIVSYDNVANTIQTALNSYTYNDGTSDINPPEFKNATCIYSNINNGFIVYSGVKGSSSKISTASAPTTGKDISLDLGLSKGGIVEGYDSLNSLTDVLTEIQSINGNYYVITTNFKFNDELKDLVTFGSFLNESNGDYLGIYNWDNPQLGVMGSGAISQIEGFNGLYIDFNHNPSQNAVSAGLISSMDLSSTNGNFNINFNEFPSFIDSSITSQDVFDGMNSNKANGFYTIGIKGKENTYYGQGHIMGTLTNFVNIYLCNSYLKFQKQIAVSNMFTSQALIPLRGSNSEGIIRGYLDSVYEDGVKSGIIVQGVTFTSTEKETIISTFDNSEDAIKQLQNFGYYYVISKIDTINATLYITDAYVANKPTNKVVINTYILGS